MTTKKDRPSFKITAVSKEGATMTCFQRFKNVSAALDNELDHFLERKRIPALINISKE